SPLFPYTTLFRSVRTLQYSCSEPLQDDGRRNFVNHSLQAGMWSLIIVQSHGLFPGVITFISFPDGRYRFKLTEDGILGIACKSIGGQPWKTKDHDGIREGEQITLLVKHLPGAENDFCRIAIYITRHRHNPVW